MTSAIIIDDDYDTARTFADYLNMLHVNVLATGYDGKQAVHLYEQHKPDIMFLDIMMPEYDGFYALERIRKFDPLAKVIVVTADLRGDTEERLSTLSPTEVIYKPYDPQILRDLVERYGS